MAPRSPERTPRVPETTRRLETQCAVAVLALVVFHIYQFCNTGHYLYFGTAAYTLLNSLDAADSWLFVIVAYLLFTPIARAVVDHGPPIRARRLLTTAAVRVLPVYYVAVVVVWLPRQASLPGDWPDLIEHLTFTQVFDNGRIFWTIGPAWALSAAVWCALAIVGIGTAATRLIRPWTTRRQRVGVLAGAAATLAAGSIAWKGWAFAAHDHSTNGSFATWFGPAAVLDNLAIGMCVALTVVARRSSRPLNARQRAGLRVLSFGSLALAFAARQPGSWTSVFFLTLSAAGFGCLVASTVLGPPADSCLAPARDTLGRRTQDQLGGIAFSTYLWHEPVLLALRPLGLVEQAPAAFSRDTLVVVTASLLAAWISYISIERPALRLAHAFATSHPGAPPRPSAMRQPPAVDR